MNQPSPKTYNQSRISANHVSLISNKLNSRSSTSLRAGALESPFSSLSEGSWRGASGFLSPSRTICRQSWRKVSPARGARSGCSGRRAGWKRTVLFGASFGFLRVLGRGGLSKALNSSQVSPPSPSPSPLQQCGSSVNLPGAHCWKSPLNPRPGDSAHTRVNRLHYAYHDRLCRISANYTH